MKSLAWKLAIVAAVAGVGFLVILQAQRAMTQALANKAAESPATDQPATPAAEQPTPADRPTLADQPLAGEPLAAKPKTDAQPTPATPSKPASAGDPFDPAFSQNEPTPTNSSKAGPAIAAGSQSSDSQPSSDPKHADTDTQHVQKEKPVRTADSSKSPDGNSEASGDPFSETANTKKSDGPTKSGEPASPTGSPVSPANATTVEDPSRTKPDPANAVTPTGGPAVSGVPSPTEPNQPATINGQPQSSGPPPLELPAAGKTDGGPQLLGPGDQGAGPALGGGVPGNSPPGNSAPSHDPANNSPPGGTPPGSTSPGGTPAVPGNGQPNKGPGSSDKSADAAGSAFPSDSGPGLGNSHDGPSTHPSPFPSVGGKELPIPNAAASAATHPSSPQGTGESHPENGPDVQGDGTVGEQAPLGPQRPQLSIEKIAPQNALLGQPLIYSIIVKNSGASEAHEVVVEDRIPKGTRLTGTIPRAELSGKKLAWRLGNLGPGEQKKISIRVVPLEAGEIGSVATVNFVAEAAAETVITAPKLQFELIGQATARLGESVPFHFKVRNVGTGEARGVVIRDLIPDAFSHAAGSDLEYEVGRLPAGKAKELTLDLKAVKVGPTINRAVVIAEGGVSVEGRAPIEIIGSKINLSRSGPTRRYLGRAAVYSNTITNESKFALEGVSVVESVPTGMEFAGASHGGQYNDGSRTIAWTIERMPPGETWVLKSKLVPKAPGSQLSVVRVIVANTEPVQTSAETVVEGFAALGLEVQSVDGPIDIGEKLTLRINARNKGSVVVTNAVVNVTIPEQMRIVSARGPGSHEQHGNVVRFGPIPTLEGRTAAACELVLEAQKRGDSRIDISLQADQLQKPLSREESILILADSPSPTAAR